MGVNLGRWLKHYLDCFWGPESQKLDRELCLQAAPIRARTLDNLAGNHKEAIVIAEALLKRRTWTNPQLFSDPQEKNGKPF